MSQSLTSDNHDTNDMELDNTPSPKQLSPPASPTASDPQDASSPPPFDTDELPPTAPSLLPEGGISTISGAPTDLTSNITSAFTTNLLSTGKRIGVSPADYLVTLEGKLKTLNEMLSHPLPESTSECLQTTIQDLESQAESE